MLRVIEPKSHRVCDVNQYTLCPATFTPRCLAVVSRKRQLAGIHCTMLEKKMCQHIVRLNIRENSPVAIMLKSNRFRKYSAHRSDIPSKTAEKAMRRPQHKVSDQNRNERFQYHLNLTFLPMAEQYPSRNLKARTHQVIQSGFNVYIILASG